MHSRNIICGKSYSTWCANYLFQDRNICLHCENEILRLSVARVTPVLRQFSRRKSGPREIYWCDPQTGKSSPRVFSTDWVILEFLVLHGCFLIATRNKPCWLSFIMAITRRTSQGSINWHYSLSGFFFSYSLQTYGRYCKHFACNHHTTCRRQLLRQKPWSILPTSRKQEVIPLVNMFV